MKVLYLYVPVVHKGVIDLLEKYKGTPLWLLDNVKGAEVNVYLERDIRALPAGQVKLELEAHGYTDIEVVDQKMLHERASQLAELIVSNDEIVSFFVEAYAPNVHRTTVSAFLRWTKPISTVEYEVPPDRTITTEDFHKQILLELATEADKSPDWWRQIAAALVKEGVIVLRSHNKHFPTQQSITINGDPRSNLDAGEGPGVYTSIHAEASVFAQAAKKGISTDGCDMYVTTFPCPTCARSIAEAGIRRVFYAKGYSVLDAETILRDQGVEIILVKDSD